jgi:hypothetical protein
VKHDNDLVLVAKEETLLLGMFYSLNETGRCCGMEINVEKTTVMRIWRQPSAMQIMVDQKQTESVEYFKYFM